jgi:predicted transglutaminase-like cysteine proteinase
MTFGKAAGAALLGIMMTGGIASAAGFPGEAGPGPRAALAHAPALPPIGFVAFCARNPAECRPARGMPVTRLRMTPERWRAVRQVNSHVNASIVPVSDEELYGEAEHWAYPSDAGDCEDYVLMKQRYLGELGFARSALLITVVLDERDEGHAVLTLRTTEGDFVLDNRRGEIRRWTELGYTFLKRQSARDPRHWVSLARDGAPSAALTAARAGAR